MGASTALLILAAGAGSRFGGLKQLTPIGPGGETLLEYSVFDASHSGFSKVVIVVRPETEAVFRTRFESGMANHVPIAYVHQNLHNLPAESIEPDNRSKPWGTGHAVLTAASEVEGSFAVINADDFYGAESFATLAEFFDRNREVRAPSLAVVGFPITQTLTDSGPVSRGVLELDDSGRLQRIVEVMSVWRQNKQILFKAVNGEDRSLTGSELVSMNMWGFSPDIFPELQRGFSEFLARSSQSDDDEFLLPEVIQSQIRNKRFEVEVLQDSGRWCGLTFRQDLDDVRRIISDLVDEGRYPKELWK